MLKISHFYGAQHVIAIAVAALPLALSSCVELTNAKEQIFTRKFAWECKVNGTCYDHNYGITCDPAEVDTSESVGIIYTYCNHYAHNLMNQLALEREKKDGKESANIDSKQNPSKSSNDQWQQYLAENNVLPHAPNQQIAQKDRFIITLSSSVIHTENISVTVNGSATGSKLSELTVDGTTAPFNADGSFAFQRTVPIGQSIIHLVATNEWGEKATAEVRVNRVANSSVKDDVYPPLDPTRAHGLPRPTAIALIIGIERYKNAPIAEFADNDARSFYDYAINALGVPEGRIKLLTNGEATKIDMEAALITWLKPQIVGGSSEVFIFFAGHGLASDDGKDTYLLPQDANRAVLDRSALRRKELIDTVVGSGAKSVTMFLDTCYSGGTRGNETLAASARPMTIVAKELAIPQNVTVLSAAANDQLSSSMAATKHGLFSYYLMRGLEGEAADANGKITLGQLGAYLQKVVPPEAAKLGRSQTPQLSGDGEYELR